MKKKIGLIAILLSTLFVGYLLATDRHTVQPNLSSSVDQNLQAVFVPESHHWAVLALSPVIKAFSKPSSFPYLIVYNESNFNEYTRLIQEKGVQHSFLFKAPNVPKTKLPFMKEQVLSFSEAIFEVCLTVHKNFWTHFDQIVLASTSDINACIYASHLASIQKKPVFFMKDQNTSSVLKQIENLKTKEVLFVSSKKMDPSKWEKQTTFKQLTIDETQKKIMAGLGPTTIKNIVLCKTPTVNTRLAMNSFLAPYYSQVRQSMIVLTDTNDAIKVEQQVKDFIHQYQLKPRSLTILADHEAIGVKDVSLKTDSLDEFFDYSFYIEPCSLPKKGHALSLAIGRLPLADLSDTALLINRGFIKEHTSQAKLDVLMIANPKPKYDGLPLCETVSRLNALEFKNFGFNVHEYYQLDADSQSTLAASELANLIIFQGHSEHQRLIRRSDTDEEEDDFNIFIENLNASPSRSTDQGQLNWVITSETRQRMSLENSFFQESLQNLRTYFSSILPLKKQNISKEKFFNGLPLVVLQSCNSLENVIANRIFRQGGVGFIGSVTKIHSASGSSFIKVFSDGLLYRQQTLGEAMRDARNYFFLIQDLKNAKGHKEQVKSLRVALSFQLWADPELKLFSVPKSTLAPASFKWKNNHTLNVKMPAKKLPEARTEQYFIKNFPGSAVAGLVKKQKNDTARRVSEIHYLRLDVPDSFTREQYTSLTFQHQKGKRTAFRLDEQQKQLYILFMPSKTKKNKTYTLTFKKS